MTRKERLQRCYFNKETDRPAVFSRRGFPSEDPTYNELIRYIDEFTEVKESWSSGLLESPYHTETRTEPHSEDFQRRITTLNTPKGNLEASHLESLKGQPGLHETYLINSREDAEKYLSLPFPEITGNCQSFFNAVGEMNDKGIVEVSLGMNPGGLIASICGSENFAMLTITDRDIIHELCKRQMNIIITRLKFMLDHQVGPFFSMLGQEYIVPPLHGPDDFYDFNVKYDKPIIDLIHNADGRIHVHSHGSIKNVFQGFIDMGVDVLHPFEGPPMGDITPKEAKALSKDKMCLEGNIQINRFYENSPEEIHEETEALIQDTFYDNKGLIVSATASPYIRGCGTQCFPQYKAMIDTVLNYS